MDKRHFPTFFPWHRYSCELKKRIIHPRFSGFFTKSYADERSMRLEIGEEGSLDEGYYVRFYFLIDPLDGVIADVCYQVYGESALIGAAEVASELLIRKTYEQAMRMSADLLDHHVKDKKGKYAFPEETFPYLNLVLMAVENGCEKCFDIPLPEPEFPIAKQTPLSGSLEKKEYPQWKELPKRQKMMIITQVIEEEIKPYVELDNGGVSVLDIDDHEGVVIKYEGACTSCYSSIGGTLSAIQEILRAKVHPDISVTPDMSSLTLS